MRKTRNLIAAFLLAVMAGGAMSACGETSSSMRSLDSATAAEVAQIAAEDSRLTGELQNKTIKWIANWDINPDSTGKNVPIELAIFQSRYGGKIEWTNVDWNSRWDTIAQKINGAEGIDFFPASDLDAFPRGAIKDMFVPVDDYIDLNDPLFADMKPAMDRFQWQGKHYVIVNSVSGDNCCVIYNKDTIQENGLKDPKKLFEEGNWTWDTFTQQLKQFVDIEQDRFGLDGWWFEAGLSATCGVPYIDVKDGKLINNLKDPAIQRLQNWFFDLGQSGLVAIGVGDFGWESKESNIGEGKELYFIAGLWQIYSEKPQWSKNFGDNVMFVPVPKDPNAAEYYIPCGLDGFVMLKGGQNPQGVAKYAACKRVTITNERANQIATQQLIDDYGWTQEMVDMRKKVDQMAQANPYFDFYNAVSSDVSGLLDEGENSIRVAAKGNTPWSESVSAIYAAVDNFLKKYNG